VKEGLFAIVIQVLPFSNAVRRKSVHQLEPFDRIRCFRHVKAINAVLEFSHGMSPTYSLSRSPLLYKHQKIPKKQKNHHHMYGGDGGSRTHVQKRRLLQRLRA